MPMSDRELEETIDEVFRLYELGKHERAENLAEDVVDELERRGVIPDENDTREAFGLGLR